MLYTVVLSCSYGGGVLCTAAHTLVGTKENAQLSVSAFRPYSCSKRRMAIFGMFFLSTTKNVLMDILTILCLFPAKWVDVVAFQMGGQTPRPRWCRVSIRSFHLLTARTHSFLWKRETRCKTTRFFSCYLIHPKFSLCTLLQWVLFCSELNILYVSKDNVLTKGNDDDDCENKSSTSVERCKNTLPHPTLV